MIYETNQQNLHSRGQGNNQKLSGCFQCRNKKGLNNREEIMKEVWVKKTIWRRYLIEDSNEIAVSQILKGNINGDEIVADCYDSNERVEYDNEEVILPIEFEIKKA